MKSYFPRILCTVAAALMLLAPVGASSVELPADEIWAEVEPTSLASLKSASPRVLPQHYRALEVNPGALAQVLAAAPAEDHVDVLDSGVILALPLPEGGFGRFRIVEAPIMAPGLAAKFPQIRTYRGQGIDDPAATVRLDQTHHGFHAMVLSPHGTVYIDPFGRQETGHYISYLAQHARSGGRTFQCEVTGHDLLHRHDLALSDQMRHQTESAPVVSGATLRTYRLAVAATGEYTAFHGGTVADGQAAIVTAMNRVNGVYEREVAIRMVLVANNDQVVYTNGSTDPYSNGNGPTMLGQNQSNLDSVIGNANYDIGHVFSTGGGGVATLRVPCVSGSKARGVTGQNQPIGDPFWVDFVAHEMGHQWGGNHTFNGTAGSCAGGNRNGSTAYEPGSGSTIQAYAGICGAQDLQPNSDDYFHGVSLDQIIAYSTTGNGDGCPVRTATGNTPPTANAGASFTIPLETPFELCGTGNDADGDALTYGWEEFDLGPAGAPNSPSGNAPIFRTFDPSTSPCRTFPQLSDLVNNTQTIGELLPTFARTLNFRLTVRDNRSGGGGIGDDSTTVTVSDVGGPFLVTAPNTAVLWAGGSSRTVTWNVAGTDQSPISCSSVDILLSTDGGNTYSTTLASATANDGSQSITVPSVGTTTARVKVQCSGNIFFDISNADFQIDATGNAPAVNITAPANGATFTAGDSVTFTGTANDVEDGDLSASLSWNSSIDGSIGSGASFSTTTLSVGTHTITASVTDSGGLQGSDSISITVNAAPGGGQTAIYNAGLGAPACTLVGSSCDSGALLDGRNSKGPEPNQPNTLDGCADGNSGTYHDDESNDRIVVSAVGGGNFIEGATVRIDATVWAWNTGSEDSLDLYYTADANNPSWTYIGTLSPSSGGAQTLSTTYTLPTGTLQAVRANFRYQGSVTSCSTGNWDDTDDLVFAVEPLPVNNPPTVNITAPADGSSSDVGDSVPFTGTANDTEDGDLSASLSWNSSIDGNIGSGASFSTTTLSAGNHTITASVTDSGGAPGSDSISITVHDPGTSNGPQNAVFDAGLGVPACAIAGSSCDSQGLLDGRHTKGPEPNQPNTLDGCTDGTSGTYHSDESNDRIVVSTLDGADFAAGATVQVDATVWAWSTGSQDSLDLYYAADANSPSWTYIGTLSASSGGAQTLSTTYTLPSGSLQAVRARFRYQGSASPCGSGNWDDVDDLVFAVN